MFSISVKGMYVCIVRTPEDKRGNTWPKELGNRKRADIINIAIANQAGCFVYPANILESLPFCAQNTVKGSLKLGLG